MMAIAKLLAVYTAGGREGEKRDINEHRLSSSQQ
ncbi:Uncharacterised protein [uncultured archaeon]|nr:Uncharacterised protein [uncultured archaeon]